MVTVVVMVALVCVWLCVYLCVERQAFNFTVPLYTKVYMDCFIIISLSPDSYTDPIT